MMKLQHKFVKTIPDVIEPGILYISLDYCTAIHRCVCGCGHEVVTPISPTDWQLKFDGETVSLNPSIGNWSYNCQSHYWIINNEVRFSRKWSGTEIEKGRKRERKEKKSFYKKKTKKKD